jgi:hypothetical protein
MDYSKIQNGMESIIEALKENNSESNGVEYSGISDMLHGQSDILKNFLQGSFSADMRADMKKAIEASTGQGQAESTTDLVKSVKVVAEFYAHLEDLNLGSIESLSDKLDDLTATLSRTDLEELNSDINTLTKVCTDNRADIARVHDSMNAQFDKLGVDLFKRVDNVGETIDALFSHTDTGQESAKEAVISAVYDQLGNLQREILTESQLKEYVSQTRQETESQYDETHRMLTVLMERLNSIEDTQIATDQKALEEKLVSVEPDEGISTKRAILNLESRINLLESWVSTLSEDCNNYKEKIKTLESFHRC